MITVDLAAPFSDPRVYANPFFFPVVNDLLGGAAVLSSFGAVCALPGAPAQHIHVDHPPLFEETGLAPLLPCHAVTVVLPLVDLDAASGATAVWPGSHREVAPVATTERAQDEAFVPQTRLGSMYMMDYRLVHRGTANSSDHPRAILYAVYTRPWFSDASNFQTQPGLRMSSEDLAAVPDAFRTLFLHRQSSR
jgi:ectoine hydroxylase-related dioxygenase (phytanoyl-CoA dioxygenase family)